MSRSDAPLPVVLGLGGLVPAVNTSAWIAPTAVVVGAVTVGAESSIWYSAVVRADDEVVVLGARSNLQDGAIVHADPGFPARIGCDVTIGHGAVVHGATVEDNCLIGMNATVLNGATIGQGSIIAAGAVVRENTVVPAGSLVAGVPAVVRGEVGGEGAILIAESASEYVDKVARHQAAVPALRQF